MLLVGGFGVPSWSMVPLQRALRDRGHTVTIAATGMNVDCGEATVTRLLASLDEPTAVVGHSRGGQVALVAAVRRPELIPTLVTVATPWSIGPPDRPGIDLVARGVRALQRRGVRILPSIDCATASCCDRYRADLGRRPAARWVALWSSTDRVAGVGSRPPAGADRAVDVGGGHLGMVVRDGGIRAVIDALDPPH